MSPLPNLELLRESAEEHPGTQDAATGRHHLGRWPGVDGVARLSVQQARASTEALDQGDERRIKAFCNRSDDERLQNRAHLGLARVYEMQNELDKARDEYLKVTGGYAEFAEERAKQLGRARRRRTCTPGWRRQSRRGGHRPMGPGTPGQTPEFSAGDMPLPGATPARRTGAGGRRAGHPFDNLLQGLGSDRQPRTERIATRPVRRRRSSAGGRPATGDDRARRADRSRTQRRR